jgi:hypothetical protein
MGVASMAVVVVSDVLLLCLFGLLPTLLHHLDVIVQNGSDDRNHVSLHHPCTNPLSAANSYVDDALKGEIPFPHVHHILAPPLF